MTIRQSAPPNLTGQPKVDFKKNNFDSAIWDKGYDVVAYSAVQCPCNSGSTANLTDCENCLGLGWVFINPKQSKAIITSINRDTKYKFWSPEFKGTVALTLRDVDRLAFMDKVILKNKVSIMSEVRPVRTSGVQKFIFASYPVDSISSIFIFNGSTNPLIKVSSVDYEISTDNPYVVKLSDDISFPTEFNNVVSINYKHEMQYTVVDIPHDVRDSSATNRTSGKQESQKLPIQAIAQKSHYITGDSPKYNGTGLQNNNYL